MRKVLVLGGGGYVGSMLCPALVDLGLTPVAYDMFWYGQDKLPKSVWQIQGDIRDAALLRRTLIGCDAVIHLACISNDPSYDLDPTLGQSINWDSFPAICQLVKDAGVSRFIYASSSSVYGVKEGQCTEDVSCAPITDYSKFKLKCEKHLHSTDMGDVTWTVLRPATVCGYAPRLRLDLVVNALSISAIVKNEMTVNGGPQLRPNIHIKDMVRAYLEVLKADKQNVHQQVFNVGAVNASIAEIAKTVESALSERKMKVSFRETNDTRSYHINSDKIKRLLDFSPELGLRQAIKEIALRYGMGEINPDSSNYYNVRRMKEVFK